MRYRAIRVASCQNGCRRPSRLAWLASGLLFALGLAGCDGFSLALRFPSSPPKYSMAFEDQFAGGALDGERWSIASADGCPALCGQGESSPRRYDPDAISVRDGALFIEGRQDADGAYLSGAIHSRDKFDFRYGRVEAGARLPAGVAMKPRIRLLPADSSLYGPWPASGEMIVAEGFAAAPDGVSAVRGGARYGLPGSPSPGASFTYDLGQAPDLRLVEYALEWDLDELRFFLDGTQVQRLPKDQWFAYYPADAEGRHDALGAYRLGEGSAPFDQAFHLVIDFVLSEGPEAAANLPQSLEVDYVRVFQCVNDSSGVGLDCGSRDDSLTPLQDNAGGPLQGLETARPHQERLDLYADGPKTLSFPVAGAQMEATLRAAVLADPSATWVSDLAHEDPEDPSNQVWRLELSGGDARAYLAAPDLSPGNALQTGFDFSGNRRPGPGGQPVGEIAFDMRVDALAPGARLSVGLDDGYPDAPRFELPSSAIALEQWKTYSVKFADLLGSPNPGCCGLDLANLIKPFVLQVAGGDFKALLDNIRVTNACHRVGACGADAAEVASPRRACTDGSRPLNLGFYAYFAPMSHSADPNPEAAGFNVHQGYEAGLLTALEAMQGAGLAFSRRGIGFWEGIWLLSATPEYDLIGGGITILESRTMNAAGETRIRFTDGHVAFRQSLLVRAEDAARLPDHDALSSEDRVGVLPATTGEARLLQLTGLADEQGVLAKGTRIETPEGTLVADGSPDFWITAAGEAPSLSGRLRLHPPDATKPQVIYLGAQGGEQELLDALAAATIDAVARGEIGNSDAAAASDGQFAVTALDPVAEYGGFTVAEDNPELLSCLNGKIRWLTDGGRIGYSQWRQDSAVFLNRAEAWNQAETSP